MITTAAQLLELARSRVVEITPSGQEPHRRLIDVREQHEYDAGHIPGAMHMSRGLLETLIEQHIPDRGAPLTLYCAAGIRSLLAAKTLRDMGYRDVVTMSGGFDDWALRGLPVATAMEGALTVAQRARYARHLQLP
ncbi:MAG: rhodanese-like domain-containing protein [Mycobacteriales bacterium]